MREKPAHIGNQTPGGPRPGAREQLLPGQVLLLADPDRPAQLRLHRLSKLRADGQLITKGDPNQVADSSPVDFAAVREVSALLSPFVGAPLVWAGKAAGR